MTPLSQKVVTPGSCSSRKECATEKQVDFLANCLLGYQGKCLGSGCEQAIRRPGCSRQTHTFLEELLVKCYPTGRVVLVIDNASYHKSAAALAALSLFEFR